MFARAVKTDTELRLVERSTRLNEAALRRTVAAWDRGATWRDLNRAYASAVIDLGGFVRDPGGMVWGHPRGVDSTLMLATGLEDDEVTPGIHVMFDRHGTLDLYCRDGGKTWVMEGAPATSIARRACPIRPGAEQDSRLIIWVSALSRSLEEPHQRWEGNPDARTTTVAPPLALLDQLQLTADLPTRVAGRV